MSLTEMPLVAKTAEPTRARDWYKDVVIYQLHVRSFYDSNGDGIGDFAGLIEKLDYVASLGVTAIWLLPFYPSPLRDEGYDIADYLNVNPTYGTLDEFRKFLDAAHNLGLSVITEMVINHTSDQHPWFQRARRAPKGSSERDFYVWSDTSDRFPEVRIIFQDFETSNWAWDPIAQQYYWHRFYSHQPDLNFDNPAVQQAVLDTVDFWFKLGIDGLRLDAIPYLFERDGTNCESLPETHAFLRKLRKHIDERFPGRMLLAEANQWPDETAAFFGDDDECQMCFNFPLMPRLFMALQQEERFPIVDILRHTPSPPPDSQWAIFLRNHDELTLEMVTEEERAAMYRFFATDPQSRVNAGLRRRLAPLLRNDRRKLEVMHSLLFSLPGTPVMYYGDEIRMGDNIYLRDRDSVRTPMQWNSDRNAGFSDANTQRLFLPTIVDPEFHYQSWNVETEEQNPHSFLWWLRRVLRLRHRYPAFSRGDLEFVFPQNPRIMAFLRRHENETLLVIVNLSRLTQFAELDLSAYRGRTPVELFGETRFPMIGDLPYLLTLGPYGFYWFRLDWPQGEETRRSPDELPAVHVAEDWHEAFRRPVRDQTCEALATYLLRQAWYQTPERTLRAVEVRDIVPLAGREEDGSTHAVVLVTAHYASGEPTLYQMVFTAVHEQRAQAILHDRPTAGVLRVVADRTSTTWFICDATAERGFWERAVSLAPSGEGRNGRNGVIERRLVDAASAYDAAASTNASPLWRLSGMRGTVTTLDSRLFFKLFRRVEPGVHPEIEMTTALAPHADVLPCPRLRSDWEFCRQDLGKVVLGAVYDLIPYERSLADWCREDLRRTLEAASAGAVTRPDAVQAEAMSSGTGTTPLDIQVETHPVATKPTPPTAQRSFALLGRRLAEIHLALADMDDDPAFTPEVFSTHYRRSLHFGVRGEAQRTYELLRNYLRRAGAEDDATRAQQLLQRADQIDAVFGGLLRSRSLLWRIRCHGTLGVNEVLLKGDDLQIVDWGGDPRRPFSERRIKRCVLDDLARLDASLQLTTFEVQQKCLHQVQHSNESAAKVCSAAGVWRQTQLHDFTSAYRAAVVGSLLVPDEDEEFADFFGAYRLDAAMEGLLHALELQQHDRVPQALAACLSILSGDATSTTDHAL
jgi:maltose alpha-D-glucosyltransferase/alpha-amylase